MSKKEIEALKNMKASAYKSMLSGKLGLSNSTPQKKQNLINWKKEKWINLSALLIDGEELPCGTKGKKQKERNIPSVCRPSIKVNEQTPKPLASELSNSQIQKAINLKKKGERIMWRML